MRKKLVTLVLLSLLSITCRSQDASVANPVQIQIPLRFETLGTESPPPQVGAAIVVSNLANADKQISTVLLRGLQNLGLLIESPKLDLTQFLEPNQEWRSSTLELNTGWINGHDAYEGAPVLPTGRIYAVQYAGRYQYAPAVLRIVLTITLFERSRLGPLRKVSFAYSDRYFAERLERSIQSQLIPESQKK